MNVLRSFLFNIQFYIGTSILVTICLPCLLFPRPVVLFVNRIWCLIMIKGMKWWLNTDINIIGKIPKVNDHIPEPKLGINFKILEADHRKIHKVVVSRGETLGEK